MKRGAWFNLCNDFHVSHLSIEIRSLQNLNQLFLRLNTETVEADELESFKRISWESLLVIFALSTQIMPNNLTFSGVEHCFGKP